MGHVRTVTVITLNRSNSPASEGPTLGGFYDALVSAVVRPPRFDYDTRLLGPSSFTFGGRRYHPGPVRAISESVTHRFDQKWAFRGPCVGLVGFVSSRFCSELVSNLMGTARLWTND